MGQATTESIEARAERSTPPSVVRFCGQYVNAVDTKNRVVVPAPMRRGFADEGGLLTLWKGPCLAALPHEEFDAYYAHIAAGLAASTEEAPDDVLRELWRSTSEMHLDLQGRLVLPEELRAAVLIGTEVRFCGFGRRVELWPAEVTTELEAARIDHQGTISMLQSSYDVPRVGG